uniref:Striated muscle enriched protein kinase b n=1 Tax=Erpetoichthys calabaricus TaxID=27687 RepID=A0A8C4SY69_ERPCA
MEGNLTSSGNLKVIPSIEPLFTRKLDILEVIEGRTARFDCKVMAGLPYPTITWFHNESSHFTFVYDDNECSLVVLNTTEEDSGVYTCTAKNLAGSVYCKAELTVHAGKKRQLSQTCYFYLMQESEPQQEKKAKKLR